MLMLPVEPFDCSVALSTAWHASWSCIKSSLVPEVTESDQLSFQAFKGCEIVLMPPLLRMDMPTKGVLQFALALLFTLPQVPKILEPSREEVDQYLQKFVSEMSALFERHKAASGCQNMQLRVL